MAERADDFVLLARTVAACIGDEDDVGIYFHVYVWLLAEAVIFYDEEGSHVKFGAKEACGGSRDGVFLVTGNSREEFSELLASNALSMRLNVVDENTPIEEL